MPGHRVDGDIEAIGAAVKAGTGTLAGFQIGGAVTLAHNGNYTILYDPDGHVAIWCGNAADGRNFYDNDGHHFRKRDLTDLGLIDATGVTSQSGDFRSPTERFRSIVSVAALANNGTYVVRSAVGQGGELLVIADVTGRFAAHSSVGPTGSTEYVGGAVNASVFSAVKDTAGKINCYFETGVGLVVQNKRGVGINFGFIWQGT